ncbi:hypothetical protein OE88DRAFT_1652289 [Heliocybe sulcata]|uniref:Uncharacterized protein n=1 Tax=Heliocybe sulcata TaxID=5364 RepID=A0A5C3NFZ0_9AGAM|nr:hypothetical protein OE88DRAFT_1652289 [Heliocybe sulcata]
MTLLDTPLDRGLPNVPPAVLVGTNRHAASSRTRNIATSEPRDLIVFGHYTSCVLGICKLFVMSCLTFLQFMFCYSSRQHCFEEAAPYLDCPE